MSLALNNWAQIFKLNMLKVVLKVHTALKKKSCHSYADSIDQF